MSPLQIALLTVGVLSLIAVGISVMRRRATFAGYEEIAADARALALLLRGEVFRDGMDLVVSGNFEKLPVLIRFSNSENTPGLNIRMQAPASFSLSVAPAAMQLIDGGRSVITTGEHMFDLRFTTRSNHPTQAKIFASRQVVSLFQRLCCSSKTFFSMSPGIVELSELVMPPHLARHVAEHLKVMAQVAQELRHMPGAAQVKVVPFERERHLAARIAVGVGAAVTIAILLGGMQSGIRPTVASADPGPPAGVLPVDAYLIPGLAGWRIATAADLDPAANTWLRNNGVEFSGKIEGDYSGDGKPAAAYLLVNAQGNKRVVLLSAHQNCFDSRFPAVRVVARVPRAMVKSIEWAGGKGPGEVQGDGLLLATGTGDQVSAVVLFIQDSRLLSFAPANYQSIRLR